MVNAIQIFFMGAICIGALAVYDTGASNIQEGAEGMRTKVFGLVLVILSLIVLVARGIYEYGLHHPHNIYFASASMVLLLVGVVLFHRRA